MPQKIPVKALKDFAKSQGLTHAILLAHDGSLDHVVTYGADVNKCSQAADFGNRLKKEMGWPDSLQAHPSTVAKLKKEIIELKEKLDIIQAARNN